MEILQSIEFYLLSVSIFIPLIIILLIFKRLNKKNK